MLTWAAKEQIRYLNAEYPDEWTPERLAESFPVSVDGVRRLLRSRFVPQTPDEIDAHDTRAKRNLMALISGSGRRNVANSKNALRLSADANTMLPMPQLPFHSVSGNDEKTKTGLFSSLLLQKSRDGGIVYDDDDAACRLLEDGSTPSTTNKKYSGSLNTSGRRRTNVTDGKVDRLLETSKRSNGLREGSLVDCSSPSVSKRNSKAVDSYDVNEKLRSVRGRRPRHSAALANDWNITSEGIGNQTQTVHSFKNDDLTVLEQKACENESLLREKTPASNPTFDTVKQAPNMCLDEEIYMYDEKKGYQYPYGRRADVPVKNVDIQKCSQVSLGKSGLAVYKKGNDFYDEDGEFLFRVS